MHVHALHLENLHKKCWSGGGGGAEVKILGKVGRSDRAEVSERLYQLPGGGNGSGSIS